MTVSSAIPLVLRHRLRGSSLRCGRSGARRRSRPLPAPPRERRRIPRSRVPSADERLFRALHRTIERVDRPGHHRRFTRRDFRRVELVPRGLDSRNHRVRVRRGAAHRLLQPMRNTGTPTRDRKPNRKHGFDANPLPVKAERQQAPAFAGRRLESACSPVVELRAGICHSAERPTRETHRTPHCRAPRRQHRRKSACCRERHAGGLLWSRRAKQRAPQQNRGAFHPWKPRCECSPLHAADAVNRLMAGSLTSTLFIVAPSCRTLTGR